MKVWIDISNAPHVHFFRAMISRLERMGHDVLLTARNFGPVCGMLDSYGMDYVCVGSHGGRNLKNKLVKHAERVKGLASIIARERPDMGLFKHSVEGPRVCFGLGIPTISVIDNENADCQNRLIIPFSDVVIAPEAIPAGLLNRLGARKVSSFYGICEKAHFRGVEKSTRVFKELGLSSRKPIIITREEPIFASYVSRKSRLAAVVKRISESSPEAQVVFMPRNHIDRRPFDRIGVIIPEEPVDTLNLYRFADAMVGAGGSMNREACIAGCPAISLYPEKLLMVDKFLLKNRAMRHTCNEVKALGLCEDFIGNGHEWKASLKEFVSTFEEPHDAIMEELRRFE